MNCGVKGDPNISEVQTKDNTAPIEWKQKRVYSKDYEIVMMTSNSPALGGTSNVVTETVVDVVVTSSSYGVTRSRSVLTEAPIYPTEQCERCLEAIVTYRNLQNLFSLCTVIFIHIYTHIHTTYSSYSIRLLCM